MIVLRGLGFAPRMEIAPVSDRANFMPGRSCRNLIEARFRGYRIIITGTFGLASAKAHSGRNFEVYCRVTSSFPAVPQHIMSSRRVGQGLADFVFLWCPNGAQLYRNHAVTGNATYSLDLRICPFHAGFPGLPLRRQFATL